MYFEESLYNFNTKEYVCSNHIEEPYLKRRISSDGEKGICTYCDDSDDKVVELSYLLRLIVTGIDYLFEDPVESRNLNSESEYGFDGPLWTFYELWGEDLLQLDIEDSNLYSDIERYLENTSLYCYKDEFVSEPEYLILSWDHFKEIVRHKARYVFYFKDQFSGYNYDPIEILEKIQSLIISLNLIEEIPKGFQVYRCRQHSNENEIKEISDLASAPNLYCKNNGRMNPAGVSMFYCSEDISLTIKEVVDIEDDSRPFYTTGMFESKKGMKLLNLSKSLEKPSIYDEGNHDSIDPIDFFNSFIIDITQPVKLEDSIIEYIPTQIITEYLRYNPLLNIDGIIYPSSKDLDSNNIVLFYNSDESVKNLNFDMKDIKINKIKPT